MIRTCITATLLLALIGSAAHANDTMTELKTGGLQFISSTHIAMKKEVLFISPKQVRVDYEFQNTSTTDITTRVAFPMPEITGDPYFMVSVPNAASDNFLGFTVKQDGKTIKPELEQRAYLGNTEITSLLKAAAIPLNPLVPKTEAALSRLSATTKKEWTTLGYIIPMNEVIEKASDKYVPLWTLKSAYWWQTTFPAGKTVKVSHRYQPSIGRVPAITFLNEDNLPQGKSWQAYRTQYCVDEAFGKVAMDNQKQVDQGKPSLTENWISYVLTTGGNWKDPIADFKLIVDKGSADNYVSFCGEGITQTGPTTFEMTKTNFRPQADLNILLLTK